MKDAETAVEKGAQSNPPRRVIIGGPNGAGKTTLVLKLMQVWQVNYLGADRVAEELGLGSMGADAIRAHPALPRRGLRRDHCAGFRRWT